MLKILSSLLVYIVSFGVLGIFTYFVTSTLSFHKWKPKIALVGLILLWLGFIFNIIYTGIMGWNFTPASDLESFLDSVTFVIQVVAFGLIYIGLKKIKK